MTQSHQRKDDREAAEDLAERVARLEERLAMLENHPGVAAITSKPHAHWGVEETSV